MRAETPASTALPPSIQPVEKTVREGEEKNISASRVTVFPTIRSKGGTGGEAGAAITAARAAWGAGVQMQVVGDDVVLDASTPPPANVLEGLRRQKPAIIEPLTPGPCGWNAEDWHHFYEERRGIGEHDSALSQTKAEDDAYVSCIIEWQNRNPAPSDPERCAVCNGLGTSGQLVPFGADEASAAWMHPNGCWGSWQRERKANAVEALAKLGIERRGKDNDEKGQ